MSGIVGQNLGRSSGLIKSGGVTADSIGLAEMASGTDGNIISYDSSGNPVAIATGSDGQVLTSTGAGSPPAFEAGAGGIEQVQLWNLTTAFQGAGAPNWGYIIANWSASAVTNTIGTPTMGSAPVTESSGIFSFAATGYHRIDFTCSLADNSGADLDTFGTIQCTKNNSTYNNAARSGMALTVASMVMSSHATLLLDVTDLTNQKVRFSAEGIETSTYCYGHGDYAHTYAIFTRLGDT